MAGQLANSASSTDARHGNPNGVLHGGAVLTFLDPILGHAVVKRAQQPCATMLNWTACFIGTAAPGQWIGGRITVKKLTRGFAFIDAEAFASDKLLVTTTAIFRIFERRDTAVAARPCTVPGTNRGLRFVPKKARRLAGLLISSDDPPVACRLVLDLRRQLAAVGGEFRHHLLVQPDVHAGGIIAVAGVTEFLREFLARA